MNSAEKAASGLELRHADMQAHGLFAPFVQLLQLLK